MKDVVRFILRVFFTIFFRVSITGRENIPAKGAALLCSNHIAELDMFFIGYRLKRIIHYMAKEELFKIPLVRSFIRWAGAFPVKRGAGDVGAIKTALKLLKDGHIVGIYPEGTRRARKKPEKEIKIKPGAAMLAIKTGVPIIPVAIEGTYKPFSRVKLIFGKPFYLDIEENKKYSNEEMTEMSKDIVERVYKLLED